MEIIWSKGIEIRERTIIETYLLKGITEEKRRGEKEIRRIREIRKGKDSSKRYVFILNR